MTTETTKQAVEFLNQHRAVITRLIETHGVGIRRLVASVRMKDTELDRDNWAKLHILLDDFEPGWRVKDDIHYGTTRRFDLKKDLQRLLRRLTGKRWAIGLQASYSRLAPTVGSMKRAVENCEECGGNGYYYQGPEDTKVGCDKCSEYRNAIAKTEGKT